MKNTNRFSKLKFNNGKELTNRVVVPPMASETASLEGYVTEKTLLHYHRLAQSKAGLVMVEYSHVHDSGRSEEFQLGIQSDEHLSGLTQLAATIHKSKNLVGIQLTHAGGKTTREYSNGFLMGASRIAVPVKDQNMEIPDEMTKLEINLWKESFLQASRRAVQAGFDLVELHAAHGYGLNQWLSPITNKRIDNYGGNTMNRARLLLEILESIKKEFPDLLLAVRLPGQDFLEGGLQFADTILIAKALEKIGVDIIDVSSGIGGWKRPRERIGEGYLIDEATTIQAAVKIPVIGVGGIETAAFIDELIGKEKITLAAVGRAILAAPKLWGEKNL